MKPEQWNNQFKVEVSRGGGHSIPEVICMLGCKDTHFQYHSHPMTYNFFENVITLSTPKQKIFVGLIFFSEENSRKDPTYLKAW